MKTEGWKMEKKVENERENERKKPSDVQFK